MTLFFTAELKGTIEPCGCTSDPMGDIARAANVIEGTRHERPAIFLDAGSTLFTEDHLADDDPKRTEEADKADLVAKLLGDLGLTAAGLGSEDLAGGKAGVRFPRQAVNFTGDAPTSPPKIVDVGGVKVGVFGVAGELPGLTVSDPAAAAKEAIARLRGDGAEVVVALAAMDRMAARQLAKGAPGIDLVVVGRDVPEIGRATPDVVGQTIVISPANRGQTLARIDLHVDAAGGPLTDALGPDRATAEIADLDKQIAKLAADLDKWHADPSSDAAFVKQNEDALAQMKADRADLAARPLRTPATGSWFVLRQTPIKRALACDAAIVDEKRAFDKQVGDENVAAAKDEKPAAPAAGQASYVGAEECAYCHKQAVEFWKTTHHAQAFPTLEKVGKQWSRNCIGCHVTGWMEPGGSTLAVNDKLRDVQCETCHGPASIHVDKDGKAPLAMPAADLCTSKCHLPEHSDTFQFAAYLRDILGHGHGEKRRAQLGAGPTGHELRQAALEKANQGVGANCPR